MTELCIKNLTAVLTEAGSSIEKVVKVNVFLTTMDSFAEMVSVPAYKTIDGGMGKFKKKEEGC